LIPFAIMDNTNKDNSIAEELLAAVRKTVLVTNMSLAVALEKPFIATYENDEGILMMALKPNNTSILVACGLESSTVIKCDFFITDKGLAERRSIFKCKTKSDADDVWEILTDKLEDWSAGGIATIDMD
jgi:hypothetical protein